MFFSFRLVVFYFFVLININESINTFEIKCEYSNKPRDQALLSDKINRYKRFVLFPEFKLWMNDWRYLHHPKDFIYWISNYYPKQIDSNHVRSYIHHIINNINQFINYKIVSIREASSIEKANFYYNFFNYEICPTNDPLATTKNVQSIESMFIYPRELIKKNRYRAHGGIIVNPKNNSTTSHMKFNIHHTFLLHQDFQYDPVIYTCNSDESHCIVDLYAVLLHETLHGFGIEVVITTRDVREQLFWSRSSLITTFRLKKISILYFKHTESNLPNKKMLAVMHLYPSRIMCHDDIRAIRKVYGLPVKRQNAKYDDTCRRDFPLNTLQKIMYKTHHWIIFYVFYIAPCISFIVILMTIIYILLRKHCLDRNDNDETSSIQSDDSEQLYRKQHKSAINAFLWHDDYLNS